MARRQTYEQHLYWRRYAPFTPERMRLDDGRLPREEHWEWRGLSVHLDRHETGSPRAVLIGVHGGGGYGRALGALGVIANRVGMEAVLPDLPGYGLTEVPRSRFRYQEWVACVRDLATAERERQGLPVIALGASMGGMLSWHAALEGAPFDGIVVTTLIDPRDPEVRTHLGRTRWMVPASIRLMGIVPTLSDSFPVPMAYAANMRAIANDPAVAKLIQRDKLGGGRVVPAGFLRSWMTYDAPVATPDGPDLPVLLAHPGDDRWTPTHLSQRFLTELPGQTEFVELENCGHLPLEEPGLTQLEAALGAFTDRVVGKNAQPVS